MKIYHFTILAALFFLVFWFVTDYEISCFEKQVYSLKELERIFNKASYKAAEYYFKGGSREKAYEKFCEGMKECSEAEHYSFLFVVVDSGDTFVMSGKDEEAALFVDGVEAPAVVTAVKGIPELSIVSGAVEKKSEGYLLEQQDYYKLYHTEQGSCVGGFTPLKRLETQKECAEEGAFACKCVKTGTYFYGKTE